MTPSHILVGLIGLRLWQSVSIDEYVCCSMGVEQTGANPLQFPKHCQIDLRQLVLVDTSSSVIWE